MPSVQESLCHDTTSITEALSVMIQKEQTVYTCTNYLLSSSSSSSSTEMDCTTATTDDDSSENDDVVTAKDRQLICDWCYSIVDATQFDRETVATAMEIIDRFLSSSQSPTSPYLTNRKQYQLLSMSSLYIAIKAHEQVAMSSEHFATMSNGLYTQLQIEKMEMKILHTLQWKINAPTSVQFAYSILSLLYNKLNTTTITSCEEGSGGGEKKVKVDESTWCFILDETRYQIEYALRDYALSTNERFSTLALSSIFNALDTLPTTTTTSNYDSHRRGEERDVILNALLQLLAVEYSNKFVSIEHVYNVKDRLMNFVTNSSSSSSNSSSRSNSAQADVEDEPSSPIRNDRQVMEEPTTPTASELGKAADNSRSISRSSPRSSMVDTCNSGRQ